MDNPGNILVNFPTNIGDAVLSLPALDEVVNAYPGGKVTAIVSPATRNMLSMREDIDEFIVYDKRKRFKEKICFAFSLRKGGYGIMVDFKNSLLPAVLRIKEYTSYIRIYPRDMHVKDRYISLVKKLVPGKTCRRGRFLTDDASLEDKWPPGLFRNAVFVSTFSRSDLKTYPLTYLKKVIEELSLKHKVVFLGDGTSEDYYNALGSNGNVFNLAGKTTLLDVYWLLTNYAALCLCVDSSILHLASYADVPIVSLFGPTDEKKYGPWSGKRDLVISRDDLKCRPCGKARCCAGCQCMRIDPEKVIKAVNELFYEVENDRTEKNSYCTDG